MKKFYLIPALASLLMLLMASTCAKKENSTAEKEATPAAVVTTTESPDPDAPSVYFTSNISPEGLVSVYQALGVKATGRVAVKIST
jgi:hypothetical protein